MELNREKSFVLFDGSCNFCNASVNFITRNNKTKDFIFIPLQSEKGKALLKSFHIREDYVESLVLIENKKAFLKSTAALRIAKKLNGIISWTYILLIFPVFVRDKVYDWIAKHRNSWFSKQDNCVVPDA